MNVGNIQTQDKINIHNTDQGKLRWPHDYNKQLILVQSQILKMDEMYKMTGLNVRTAWSTLLKMN